MAKRSRRSRTRRTQAVRLSSAQLIQPDADHASGSAETAPKAPPQKGLPDMRQEYRYVIADLRRIGVLAAVMLVVLIVAALALT